MSSNERLPDPTPVTDTPTRGYIEELIRVLRFNFMNLDVINESLPLVLTTAEATHTLSAEATLSCTAVCTVDLPASPLQGLTYTIRNNTSPLATVTLDGNGNNIDGVTTTTLPARYDVITVQYDNTEWMKISS